MSRTDHHRPYWVRVRDPEETRYAQHCHAPNWWGAGAPGCDLDAFDRAHHGERHAGWCSFDLGPAEAPYGRPGARDAHVYFYGPDRAGCRGELDSYRRGYNAAARLGEPCGDAQDLELADPLPRSHRRNAIAQLW